MYSFRYEIYPDCKVLLAERGCLRVEHFHAFKAIARSVFEIQTIRGYLQKAEIEAIEMMILNLAKLAFFTKKIGYK